MNTNNDKLNLTGAVFKLERKYFLIEFKLNSTNPNFFVSAKNSFEINLKRLKNCLRWFLRMFLKSRSENFIQGRQTFAGFQQKQIEAETSNHRLENVSNERMDIISIVPR